MPATPQDPEQAPGRSRRNPEARRQAIIRAAADLLVENGGDLTHRRVAERADVPLGATTYYFSTLEELREAALGLLAAGVDRALAEMNDQAAAAQGDPQVMAALLHGYLSDRAQLRADATLYDAAVHREDLRPLALRMFDGLVELLSAWTDPASARLLAVFVDGASVHAMLHDEPVDRAALTRAITALMHPHPHSHPGNEEE